MILSIWPNSNYCIVLFRYCFEVKKWATVGHFVEIQKRTNVNHKGHEETRRKTLPLMTRITRIFTDQK